MRKDSLLRLEQHGIEHVPANWTQSRVKYLGAYINGYPFKPGDWGTVGRPILRIQDLSSTDSESNRFDGEIPDRYLVRPGDILISWSASLGVYRWAGEEAWLNQHIFKVALGAKRVRDDFFLWLAEWFINEMDREVHGSTMQHLTADAFGGFPVLLPPHEEQARIAAYLDRETARLDALVAAKERVLGLLAEKRRALITRAVTRGLDPNVPLRDSGIPWLGEIPAHWETRRAAWLFRERDERGEADLPLLEVSINAGVVLREFSDERIESTAADFNTYKVARQGDVVFNKMRMWQGAVGIAPEDGLVSPDYVVAAPTGLLSPQYAGLLFRTGMSSAECARRSHGIVWDRLRLYWEGFREIELPLPSADAQREIVSLIAKETGKLDELRAATERTTVLLKERRAALIAAAVTGTIDVRGEVT
jgi:type I restriction enzyme S subunit